MKSRRSRTIWLLAMTACLLLATGFRTASAEQDSLPTGDGQAIAQGVALMPEDPAIWRVVQSTAQPAAEASWLANAPGFAIGTDQPVLATTETGDASVLHEGQADFHSREVPTRHSSLDNSPAAYLEIELTDAATGTSEDRLGDSELLFAGESFTAPAGQREMRLFRDRLAPNQSTSFASGSDAPWVIFVTDGSLTVYGEDGNSMFLESGEGYQVTGSAQIGTEASSGATWLAGTIGDEVEIPALPTETPGASGATGSLILTLYLCPPGTTDADLSACESTIDAFPVSLTDSTGAVWTLDDAEAIDQPGAYFFHRMPVGEVDIDWEFTGSGTFYYPDLEESGRSGPYLTVTAGETVTGNIYRVPSESTDARGDIEFTLYDCPAGDTANDLSRCELVTDPYEVYISHPNQGIYGIATDEGNGVYLSMPMPPGLVTVSCDPAYSCVYASDDILAGNPGMQVEIVDGGTVQISVYRLHSDGTDETPVATPGA